MSDTFGSADTQDRQTATPFVPPAGGWGEFGAVVAQNLGITTLTDWNNYYNTWRNYRVNLDDGDLVRAWEQTYGPDYMQWFFAAEKLGFDGAQYEQEILDRGWDLEKVVANYKKIVGGGRTGAGGPTKAEQYAAAEAAIRNQAQTLGYTTFGDDAIKSLAKTVVNGDWDAAQLTDYLVKGATSDWGQLSGGLLSATVEAIKAAAKQQLITVSDATAQQWASRVASGELDQNGLRSLIQMQAVGRYSWAKDVLESGLTMSDYLAPARDRLAQELEIDANSLELMDPKFMSMVTVKEDKGGYRMATDAELVTAARRDSRWTSTNNARELAASAATMLREYMEGR